MERLCLCCASLYLEWWLPSSATQRPEILRGSSWTEAEEKEASRPGAKEFQAEEHKIQFGLYSDPPQSESLLQVKALKTPWVCVWREEGGTISPSPVLSPLLLYGKITSSLLSFWGTKKRKKKKFLQLTKSTTDFWVWGLSFHFLCVFFTWLKPHCISDLILPLNIKSEAFPHVMEYFLQI